MLTVFTFETVEEAITIVPTVICEEYIETILIDDTSLESHMAIIETDINIHTIMGSFVDSATILDITDIVCSIAEDYIRCIEDVVAITIVGIYIDRIDEYEFIETNMFFKLISWEGSQLLHDVFVLIGRDLFIIDIVLFVLDIMTEETILTVLTIK